MEIKTEVYETNSGKEPFTEWFNEQEKFVQIKISAYLAKIRAGNTSFCKPIKGWHGLFEIVMDFGPGFRIYYCKEGLSTFMLLWAGEKKTQKRDIEKSYRYFVDHTGGKP